MTAVLVTAFVPIPDHPRSEAEYHDLARPLLELGQRVPMLCAQGELQGCWLYRYLLKRYDLDTSKFSHSVADNPTKNSLWYHIVQAQKIEWLVASAMADRFSEVFVWIDYGIFHVPGVTGDIIYSFLQRAGSERAIAIPGCWDDYEYDDHYPCWRFCGGVMVVPRAYVESFNHAFKREYVRWLEKTGNISWEVNTLARMEREGTDLPLWHYKADHNRTMFTNYRAMENADGQQGQEVRGIEARHY